MSFSLVRVLRALDPTPARSLEELFWCVDCSLQVLYVRRPCLAAMNMLPALAMLLSVADLLHQCAAIWLG